MGGAMKIGQCVTDLREAGWSFDDFESSAVGKQLRQEDEHCDVEAEHATGCSVINFFGTAVCTALAVSTGPVGAVASGCLAAYTSYYGTQGVRTRVNIKHLADSIQEHKKTIFYLEQIKKVVTRQVEQLSRSPVSIQSSQVSVMERRWKALSKFVPLFRDDFPHHAYVKLNNCQVRTVNALEVLHHDASNDTINKVVDLMKSMVSSGPDNSKGGIIDELISIRQKIVDHQEGELNSWIHYNREHLAVKKSTH